MNNFLSLIVSILLFGCGQQLTSEMDRKDTETFERWNGFEVVVVDSCEYIIRTDRNARCYEGYGFGFLAHKGNCKFCAERRKQELKELVEQIKDKEK